MAVKPIPEGHNVVSPYLIGTGTAKLMDFLKRTFDAQELFAMRTPDGTVGHAEMRIGDTIVMMADGGPEHPAMPATLHVYVTDVDAVYKRAIAAGAVSEREPANQFYGDRNAGVKDHCGNRWFISTHVEDLTEEEIGQRARAAGKH